MQAIKECYNDVSDHFAHAVRGVDIPASGVFVGGVLLISVAYYANQFIRSWDESEARFYAVRQRVSDERDRFEFRWIAAINGVGAAARLADWGRSVGLIAVQGVAAAALVAIGHVAGVFHYMNESIKALDEIREVDTLIEIGLTHRICAHPDDFNPYIFSLWAKYIGNLCFFTFSASQIIAFATPIIVPLALSNVLILAGVVCFIAMGIVRLSTRSFELVDECRCYDNAHRYSHIV